MKTQEKITPKEFEFFKTYFYNKSDWEMKSVFTPEELIDIYARVILTFQKHDKISGGKNLSRSCDVYNEVAKEVVDMVKTKSIYKNKPQEGLEEIAFVVCSGAEFPLLRIPEDLGPMSFDDYFSPTSWKLRCMNRLSRREYSKFLNYVERFQKSLETDRDYLTELNKSVKVKI